MRLGIEGKEHILDLWCELEGMGGSAEGALIEARSGKAAISLFLTHMEMFAVITMYREHCAIDEVAQALGVPTKGTTN